MNEPLSPRDHRRDLAGAGYVYPVHSRRAGGLSIGVNLNPGKECNWACAYCEVEGLKRGEPGAIDLDRLGDELNRVLKLAAEGQWSTGSDGPNVKDISIAGDGEPTLSPVFAQAVELTARLREEHGLSSSADLVVITNGSRLHLPAVQSGLRTLSEANGTLWFKCDSGLAATREFLNGIRIGDERIVQNLKVATDLCTTWIQTMWVGRDDMCPPDEEVRATTRLLERAIAEGARPAGILLYGLSRPSHQPGGNRLHVLDAESMARTAESFGSTGLPVRTFL